MPLEIMALTPEQQKKFERAGGLMNPVKEVVTAEKNQNTMMYRTKSFEDLQETIDGTLYGGFNLFQKVYEAFPDIARMTKEEATEAGLYPTIHFRNLAARKWMAKMNGGHLATLDKKYSGELSAIHKLAEGKINLQKLAAMGQAPLGWYSFRDDKVYFLGNCAHLGSTSLGDGDVRTLIAHRNDVHVNDGWDWRVNSVSSVVVLDE